DFAENPTPARLDAACTALARVHRAWAAEHASVGECPAVRRRSVWAIDPGRWPLSGSLDLPDLTADPVRPWAERGFRLLPERLGRVRSMLGPWYDRPVPLQYCVGDVWHDNLLFTGDQLTGLVDYAAVKVDHVAADLGRMLGSLV